MLLLANGAAAAPYTMETARSSLTFEGRVGTEKFHGAFPKFTAVIDYNPARGSGHLKATVDLASVTMGEKEQQDALPTQEWFDARRFPEAVFEADIIAAGPDLRHAPGTLTLRGIRRPLTLDFHMTPVADHGLMAVGEVTIRRDDFQIGQGQWASEQWVAYPVTVHFTIVAHPATRH